MLSFPPPPGVGSFGSAIGSQLFVPQQAPVASPAPQPPEVDMIRGINYLADYSGCGHWRMIWPEHLLNAHQKAVIHSTTMMALDERYYGNTKTVRIQRQATETQHKFVGLLKEFASRNGFKIVYEIDDIVFSEDIPEYNKFKPAFVDPKIRATAMAIMQEVDEITVTNKFMADYYREKTGNSNITVIPNYPPKWWMGNFYHERKVMRNYTRNRKRPRIVYSASGAHFDVENRVKQRDDFYHVNEVIAKTIKDFQWVFIGAYPLPLTEFVKSGQIEFHPWQRLYEYPALLASLEATMLIAPLQDNNFNKAKSDLKYIEACCYGLPIACQDICTYANAPYKFTTGSEMIDHIKQVCSRRDTYEKASKAARDVAETRWLELDDNIDKYLELYEHPYKDPKRKLLNSLAENQ